MAPPFVLPEVEENADSWGPQSVPPQFDGVPFMPFQKGERLGRIADFGQMAGRGMFAGARCPVLLGVVEVAAAVRAQLAVLQFVPVLGAALRPVWVGCVAELHSLARTVV